MHALHVYLTTAKSKEEAIEVALEETESQQGIAYDWRVMGPGRWSNVVPEVLSVEESPEEARQWLENCLLRQQKTIDWLKRGIPLDSTIGELLSNEFLEKNKYVLLNIQKLTEMLEGQYTFESGFFYVDDWDARITPQLIEDVITSPENMYLVFADLHY